MKVASFMPPERLAVLRVPNESRTPKRISWPLARKPESENVTAVESLSPTPNVTGEPGCVKNAQTASEDAPAGVTSNVTDPGWSVRTLLVLPLYSHSELLARSCSWLFPLANLSSIRVGLTGFVGMVSVGSWQ